MRIFLFLHVKRGVSLLRMWNINCNPHWRATQLPIKLGIYQVRYTCYLYFNFFLERLFRGDVVRKEKKTRVKYHLSIKRMCAVVEFFFNHIMLFLFFTRYWEILIANQTQLTDYATGIYQVRYTCYLSRIYIYIYMFYRSTVQKLEKNMLNITVKHANNKLCTGCIFKILRW